VEELSMIGYMPLCEAYNNIAQNAYAEYKELIKTAEEHCNKLNVIELAYHQESSFRCAIIAVIFEALAMEAYVNFFGAYTLGVDIYYSEYESKIKRFSTIDKIKAMCKERFLKPYPTNGQHFRNLLAIFQKRDQLVHNKPQGHNLSNQSATLKDDSAALLDEYSFVYENLDSEMCLYNELKKNLADSSGKPEPASQMLQNAVDNMAKAISQTVLTSFFGNDNR